MEHHGREMNSLSELRRMASQQPLVVAVKLAAAQNALAAADRLAEAVQRIYDANDDTNAVDACTTLERALAAYLAERGR